MTRGYIKGLGTFVPERVVKNAELQAKMDTSDEWIRQRTGIEERRYAAEGVYTSDLALEATNRALDDAGIEAKDVDLILLGTLSPDFHFPGTSCYLQEKLGLPGVPAMDIRNQCTGFLYGLATADAFVRTGQYKNVLVVGAEVHSSALDFTTKGRSVTVIFGDGAGAAVVSPTEGDERGLLSMHLHADGAGAEQLCLHIWDISKKPYLTNDRLEAGEQWPKMNGRAVFKEATTRMKETIEETLAATGYSIKDVDLVPHQANLRINQWVASELGLPDEKVVHNIQRYGNTTAASIPLAPAEARDDGRLKRGALVCLAAFGAGFTWGAGLMRW